MLLWETQGWRRRPHLTRLQALQQHRIKLRSLLGQGLQHGRMLGSVYATRDQLGVHHAPGEQLLCKIKGGPAPGELVPQAKIVLLDPNMRQYHVIQVMYELHPDLQQQCSAVRP